MGFRTTKPFIRRLLTSIRKLLMNNPFSGGKLISSVFNSHNGIYFIAILISVFHSTVYEFSILLLFVVIISNEIRKIGRVFSENAKILNLVIVLCIFMVYFYSIVCYFYYQSLFVEQSEANSYGSTLLLSFTSNLNLGLRFSSITEVMTNPPITTPGLFWGNYVYGFSHFILINIIVINILFGIIIDAFGKIRQEKSELQNKVNNTCFMCGLEKKDFELQNLNWREHIFEHHYMYNYMAFRIMLLKVKQENRLPHLDRVSLKISNMIDSSNYNFVPLKRAKGLEAG